MSFEQYSKDLDNESYLKRSNAELKGLRHRAIFKHDAAAWDSLWGHGLRLVLKIVNHMVERDVLRNIDRDEAIAVGNAAIGDALLRWNPKAGAYATWVWIRVRGAILTADRQEALVGLVGSPTDDVEVVSNTQVAGGGEFLLTDLYEEGQVADPSFAGIVSQELQDAIQTLGTRERSYLYQVYVLGIPASDLARADGVSRQRVDQILTLALNRLRGILDDQ